MPSEVPPLGVLLISGGHARAHYAFVLATSAAALGRKVVFFATNDGVHALRAELSSVPGMQEGEALRRMVGVGTLNELRAAAAELGIRRIVCEAGMRVAGVDHSMLTAGAEVAGVATFLAEVGEGQIVTL
ncbi:MAG TPA: DsrE family protein [Acetobacteraceae bacterium]|nr:DsrE family protein [Acetobacteraceae bacterium]